MATIFIYAIVGYFPPSGIASLGIFLDPRQTRNAPKHDLFLDPNQITLEAQEKVPGL